jgi:hypothetical protein
VPDPFPMIFETQNDSHLAADPAFWREKVKPSISLSAVRAHLIVKGNFRSHRPEPLDLKIEYRGRGVRELPESRLLNVRRSDHRREMAVICEREKQLCIASIYHGRSALDLKRRLPESIPLGHPLDHLDNRKKQFDHQPLLSRANTKLRERRAKVSTFFRRTWG